jgi:hypothetical protein
LVVGSGYTLHYYDEATGQHVSVPLESLDHLRVQVRETGGVVTYDELGTFTREDVERLAESADVRAKRTVVALVDTDSLLDMTPVELSCEMRVRDVDMVVVRDMYRAFHEMTTPYVEPRTQCRDWHDRRPQHRNRKRRAWR